MGYKCTEKQKEYQRNWYQIHKKEYAVRVRNKRIALRDWLREIKSKTGCSRCSENHPSCLDFHHKNRHTKSYEVSYMIQSLFNKKKILAEIDKCDLLCANCHRKEHFGVL